ncbi:hypothetical protein GJAV_G00269930, partial [Gymnothorax javanicus]
ALCDWLTRVQDVSHGRDGKTCLINLQLFKRSWRQQTRSCRRCPLVYRGLAICACLEPAYWPCLLGQKWSTSIIGLT